MPYNNTPITPSKEITGTVALPLARVKKIINTDEDIAQCSNNAAFVITVATEMFLQHLVEQAYNIVKSERKPRRNVQYRDVANAVARVENLEFLTDVVPKTTTYKQFKQKLAKEGTTPGAPAANGGLANGQGTLDGHMTGGPGQAEKEGGEEQQATNGASVHQDAMDVDDDDTEEVVEADEAENREATTSPPEAVARAPVHDDEDDDDDEMEEDEHGRS